MISSRIHQDGTAGIAKVTYDHAVYGGAAIESVEQAIALPFALPDNAIIWNGCVDVLTPVVAGLDCNVVLSFSYGTQEDIATFSDAGTSLGTVGLRAISPVGIRASASKLGGDRTLKMLIITAPITAGKFNLHLTYYLSD